MFGAILAPHSLPLHEGVSSKSNTETADLCAKDLSMNSVTNLGYQLVTMGPTGIYYPPLVSSC